MNSRWKGSRLLHPSLRAFLPVKASRTSFLIILIITSLLFTACTRPAGTVTPVRTAVEAATGSIAPGFSLIAMDGEEVDLGKLIGKAVILQFWSTSCKACGDELAALQSIYARANTDELAVIGINKDDQPADADRFAKELGLTFPLLLDREGRISNAYQVAALPVTVFVGKDGRISHVKTAPLSEEELVALTEEMLGGFSLSATPTTEAIEATATPAVLEGCVTASVLNVRTGSSTDFAVVSTLSEGECLNFNARNEEATWVRLDREQLADGSFQWVSAEYVELKGDINNLPIDRD